MGIAKAPPDLANAALDSARDAVEVESGVQEEAVMAEVEAEL